MFSFQRHIAFILLSIFLIALLPKEFVHECEVQHYQVAVCENHLELGTHFDEKEADCFICDLELPVYSENFIVDFTTYQHFCDVEIGYISFRSDDYLLFTSPRGPPVI